LQSRIKEIRDLGGKVIAICIDPVEVNLGVARQQKLDFPILSDPDLVAIDVYGLRHANAPTANGRQDISRPAVFILDREGVVRWRYLTDNWRVRVRPETIIEQLAEISL